MSKNEPFRTEAEAKALADIAAQTAAGGDPFGDDEELVAPGAENRAGAAETTSEGDAAPGVEAATETGEETTGSGTEGQSTTAEESTNPEALAALAAEGDVASAPAAPDPVLYNVMDPKAFKEARNKLITEKNEAFKNLNDGVIETDAYLAIENRVQEGLEELTAQRALATANALSEDQQRTAAVTALIDSSKAAKEIDYMADTKAQSQFDAALDMACKDPDFAEKPFAAQVAEAHRTVMFRRGLTKAEPAPTPAPAPAPAAKSRETPPAPPSLRGVPSAATPNAGGGVGEQLSRLNGQDFQDAVGRMPKAQRDAWLDS